MPKTNPKSEWRQTRIKHYYDDFVKELPLVLQTKNMLGKAFNIRDTWYELPCLEQLSTSYAYDVATACCQQALEDGILRKLGAFYLLEKRK